MSKDSPLLVGLTWMFALFRLKLYDRLISPNVMN